MKFLPLRKLVLYQVVFHHAVCCVTLRPTVTHNTNKDFLPHSLSQLVMLFPRGGWAADTTVRFNTCRHLVVPGGFAKRPWGVLPGCCCHFGPSQHYREEGKANGGLGFQLCHGDCAFPLFPNFILHHLSCSSQRKKNKRRLYTLEKKKVYLVAADLVTFVTLYVASHPFLPITNAVLWQ